ncbi:ZYRO0B11638p [Zygosaccharomyces rouxii]|uniref:ZYRO0B11638p n=1 Tax=Zygosaccharomyces rouxii (strain ATCC 2623 / CBS 732 / NBRC 1130 / NCYC 568 / NRRL Y-229) TaxID=559307 RepID=C5DRV4_ZYGRC|nr:uncharacterized protein ZYRO0B11638g [Zygosaccharomyces rouxii]KAH9199955.1 SNF2 family N-terminal domain-containing protein [Zygosaccharomyces rouxii]CAR26515.1 ZYRO0B11638p [Zygosaccharomyces rouxii]
MGNEVDEEVLENPELYGLRRSHRASAHPTTKYFSEDEDADEDEDDGPVMGSRRRKNRQYTDPDADEGDIDEEEDEEDEEEEIGDEEDDDDYFGSPNKSKRRSQGNNHGRKSKPMKAKEENLPTRFSNRTSKAVNYNIDYSDEDLLESDDGGRAKANTNNDEIDDEMNSDDEQMYYSTTPQAADEDRGVDLVITHKLKDDIDPQVESQVPELSQCKENYLFLIKWSDESYLHNTWEEYENLKQYRGIKRVDNYCKQFIIQDLEFRLDPYVTAEDLEIMDMERERRLDEFKEYEEPERIVDSQRITDDEGSSQLQYLVKWHRLNYDGATWENATEIVKLAPEQVKHFQNRTNSKILPQYSSSYSSQRPRFEKLSVQPPFIKNGELRDFQLTGINWMAFLWSKNDNGILADEMGLGKTVQTVAFISWLIFARRQNGPHLIVVPLSTMPSWQETFEKWAPELNCICYMGNQKSRDAIREYEFYTNPQAKGKKNVKFNVLLTTYEYVLKDRYEFSTIRWQFMAVDEAHRLKNAESSLYESLNSLKVSNRLLITGTPLQNNIKELAALVNFLMPGRFTIDQEIDFENQDDEQEQYIRDLHQRLQPFILRRLKKDVEKSLPSKTERILRVELSDVQTEYYRNILTKNYSALTAGAKGGHFSLLNIMNELKKGSNHPYLFDNAEERVLEKFGDGNRSRENILRGLIMSSGKMVLLDKLLTRLKKDGHRVLIFSQMVRMLDILGDYLSIKGINFQRLDGTVPSNQRRISIDHFNAPDSNDFVFLLSTRAGGLGINLMTADTVIIFDSDWNPQADLQAMARAHRIGQKNHVMVYRLVSKDTVEEEVLERARKKMILEYAIISLGVTDGNQYSKKNEPSAGELSEILKFGAGNMFTANDNQKKLEDLNLDDVLNHAEDHVTTPDLGESHLGGEEFLKQFEVTDYKADVDWDDIIPEDELKKLQDEDQKRRDDEYVQEQLQLMNRRNNALKKIKDSVNGDGSTQVSEDESGTKAARRRDKVNNMEDLEEKEIRALYKAVLKHGDITEMLDTLIADGSLPDKSVEKYEEAYSQMIEDARQYLEKEERKRTHIMEALEDDARNYRSKLKSGDVKQEDQPKDNPLTRLAAKRKEKKAVLFQFEDMKNLNAESLVNRVEDMKLLKGYIDKHYKDDPFKFKFNSQQPKAVQNWNCRWEKSDDEKLIVGVYKYGYGSWSQIRDDPFLGLENKIFLNDTGGGNAGAGAGAGAGSRPASAAQETSSSADKKAKGSKKVPGSIHLGRRVDYLITVLKDESNETSEPTGPKRRKPASKAGTPDTGNEPPAKRMKPLPRGPASMSPSRAGSSSSANGKGSKPPKLSNSNGNNNNGKNSGNDGSSSNNKNGPTPPLHLKEYDSMDEEDCMRAMGAMRTSLKRLRRGGKGLDRKEWAQILKTELTAIGNHIESQKTSSNRKNPEKLRKHLWSYSANFWPAAVKSTKLMAMYDKITGSKGKPGA